MYIAEISPAKKRGGLVLMYQLAITIGAMLGVVCAWLFAKNLQEDSWHWMFASEAVPVLLFVLFLFVVPNSPRWLAEKGRQDEALGVLTRINGRQKAEEELKQINLSISQESGKLEELFKPGIRYALLIAILLALFNNLTGWSCVAYYLASLLQEAGFEKADDAIFQGLIVFIFNVPLTVLALWLVDRAGRRPLWIIGAAAMIFSTIFMGIFFQLGLPAWVGLIAMLMILWPHAIGLGPLPWLMISELFPTRIRAKAVGIATVFVWGGAFMGTRYFAPIRSFFAENYGSPAGVFYIFAFINVLALIFGIKMLPETKGRTLEEIAESWRKK